MLDCIYRVSDAFIVYYLKLCWSVLDHFEAPSVVHFCITCSWKSTKFHCRYSSVADWLEFLACSAEGEDLNFNLCGHCRRTLIKSFCCWHSLVWSMLYRIVVDIALPSCWPVDVVLGVFSVSLKPMSFEEVYSQSSPTNCTVYCGGILTALTGKNFSVFSMQEDGNRSAPEKGQNIQLSFLLRSIMARWRKL